MSAKKQNTRTTTGASLQAPSKWDWSNPAAILEEFGRAVRNATAMSGNTPYTQPDQALRRVVYRVGRAAIAAGAVQRLVGHLSETRSARGRYSTDPFSIFLRAASLIVQAGLPDATYGLSETNIKKQAALMRVAHGWDIHWRYYELLVEAVGSANMTGKNPIVRKRPTWAYGLTAKAQRAVMPIHRAAAQGN